VRRDTMRLLPFFAIAGLLAIFDVAVCYTPQITFHSGLSLIERLLLATRSLWFYGEKMILPIPLMAIYPQWEIDAREVILYIYPIALVTTFVSLWVLRQRISRGPFAAVLFFCITLGPTLGLIDYAFMYYTYVADRFQYLASIGLIVLATGILYKLIARSGASQQIGYGLIVAICATLAVLTFQHSGTFKNRETLFRHTADNNPGAWAAWNNLGTFAFQRGELYKAKQLIEKSLEAWSEFPKANTNMGAVYVKLKEYDRAIEYCDRALKVKPDSLQALNNKGLALMNLKRHDEAIECLMKAVEVKKDDLVACRTLARIYEERNDYAEAVKWRKKVLEANPSEAEAHYELANTYYNMKAYDKAKEHYTAALELQPDHWMALNNYGYCMFDRGNLEEARRLFEKALEINPRFTKALNNMAVASIKLKQYDIAIEYCNRALEEKPGYFQALNNKSHALKQAKRFKEAVVSYTQTIALRKRGAGAHISLAGLHFDLANCYYALKDYDHALEHFTVTLRLNPEHKEARSSIEGIRTLQK